MANCKGNECPSRKNVLFAFMERSSLFFIKYFYHFYSLFTYSFKLYFLFCFICYGLSFSMIVSIWVCSHCADRVNVHIYIILHSFQLLSLPTYYLVLVWLWWGKIIWSLCCFDLTFICFFDFFPLITSPLLSPLLAKLSCSTSFSFIILLLLIMFYSSLLITTIYYLSFVSPLFIL